MNPANEIVQSRMTSPKGNAFVILLNWVIALLPAARSGLPASPATVEMKGVGMCNGSFTRTPHFPDEAHLKIRISP